jgi:hypothetical protein
VVDVNYNRRFSKMDMVERKEGKESKEVMDTATGGALLRGEKTMVKVLS